MQNDGYTNKRNVIEVTYHTESYKLLTKLLTILAMLLYIPAIALCILKDDSWWYFGCIGLLINMVGPVACVIYGARRITLYKDCVEVKKLLSKKVYAYKDLQCMMQEITKRAGVQTILHRYSFTNGSFVITEDMNQSQEAIVFFDNLECKQRIKCECGYGNDALEYEKYVKAPDFVMAVFMDSEQKKIYIVITSLLELVLAGFMYFIWAYGYSLVGVLCCMGVMVLVAAGFYCWYLFRKRKKVFLFQDRMIVVDGWKHEETYQYRYIQKVEKVRHIHSGKGGGGTYYTFDIHFREGTLEMKNDLIHSEEAYYYLKQYYENMHGKDSKK